MNRKRLVIVVIMLWMVIAGAVNARAETGVTGTQVTMGMSTALNGAASFLGTSFKMGV